MMADVQKNVQRTIDNSKGVLQDNHITTNYNGHKFIVRIAVISSHQKGFRIVTRLCCDALDIPFEKKVKILLNFL